MIPRLKNMLYNSTTNDRIALQADFPDLTPPVGYGYIPDSVGRIQVTTASKLGGSHVHGYLSYAYADAHRPDYTFQLTIPEDCEHDVASFVAGASAAAFTGSRQDAIELAKNLDVEITLHDENGFIRGRIKRDGVWSLV